MNTEQPTYDNPAVRALLNYKQADADGIMVLVSRQAIHEVVDLLTETNVTTRRNLYDALKCQECGGSGVYSTPSDYSPCSHCDGTGVKPLDGSLKDIFNDN